MTGYGVWWWNRSRGSECLWSDVKALGPCCGPSAFCFLGSGVLLRSLEGARAA